MPITPAVTEKDRFSTRVILAVGSLVAVGLLAVAATGGWACGIWLRPTVGEMKREAVVTPPPGWRRIHLSDGSQGFTGKFVSATLISELEFQDATRLFMGANRARYRFAPLDVDASQPVASGTSPTDGRIHVAVTFDRVERLSHARRSVLRPPEGARVVASVLLTEGE